MNAISHLWGILLEPAKSWQALSAKTHALLPLLLMIIGQAAMIYVYYQHVDGNWVIEQTIAGMKDASSDEIAAARNAMSVPMMMWGGIIGSFIGMPIVMAVFALYFHLVAKTMGHERSYGQWFGFTVWQSWPSIINVVIGLILILTASSPEIAVSTMSATSFANLLGLTVDNPWHSLLSAISLLMFWQLWIGMVGFRTWTGRPDSTSLMVVIAPSVVIFGIWALIVAL